MPGNGDAFPPQTSPQSCRRCRKSLHWRTRRRRLRLWRVCDRAHSRIQNGAWAAARGEEDRHLRRPVHSRCRCRNRPRIPGAGEASATPGCSSAADRARAARRALAFSAVAPAAAALVSGGGRAPSFGAPSSRTRSWEEGEAEGAPGRRRRRSRHRPFSSASVALEL